ncbi:MAG: hypothetical protein NVS4B6_27240 [Mycobacterium sp.]
MILNKAMSLIVVVTALPERLASIPFAEVIAHWTVAVNLLAGSLIAKSGRSSALSATFRGTSGRGRKERLCEPGCRR